MRPDQIAKRVSVGIKEVQTLNPGKLPCEFREMKKSHGWAVGKFLLREDLALLNFTSY